MREKVYNIINIGLFSSGLIVSHDKAMSQQANIDHESRFDK